MEQGKGSSEPVTPQVIQEYVVKIPKDKNKRFNVMRFNQALNIDVTKWKQVKMERENNLKEYKLEEEGPKFGAGSEFGREQKEEARRKKHGIIVKQYNPDDQPWILKLGKVNKKFKGLREGGVTENASYYVFTQAPDGTFEAYPVAEWYNFTPIQCFKALSAEEAEEEFGRRDKVLNYFTIMVKKRLQTDANEEEEDEEKKQKGKKTKKKEKDFKITDMDELGNTLDSEDSGSDENDDEDEKPSKKQDKKKKPNSKKKKNKKENDSDDEPCEESDEGDFDDREVDYITSSSSSEGEEIEEEEKVNRDLKGVEDEEALRKLMGDEDEEEEEEEEEQKEQEANAETKEKAPEQKAKQKKNKSDSSGESSSESSDSDLDDQKFNSAIFVQQNVQKSKKKNGSDNSAASSRANTPTKFQGDKEGHKGQKRKIPDLPTPNLKKIKTETPSTTPGSSGTLDNITEEMVRRYLQRKPMTASELLHKFKSKKTKMSSEQLVTRLAEVLKKMALEKKNIKGKMYLSLKNP